jgi:hypothetical protein
MSSHGASYAPADQVDVAAVGSPPTDEENVFDDDTPAYIDADGGSSVALSSGPHSFHPADDALASPSSSSASPNPFELDAAATAEAIAALPPPPPPHLTSDSWADMFWATASNKQRLQQFMYSRSLLLTVATQIVMLLVRAIKMRSHCMLHEYA